jgi:predicted PurR-regulated permease PerM
MQLPGQSNISTERPPLSYNQKILIAVAIALAGMVLVLVIWFARNVLLLVFAGILVGVFLQGGKRWVMRVTRLPAGFALGIVLAVLVIFFGFFITFMVPVMIDQTLALWEQIPTSMDKFKAYLFHYGLADEFEQQTEKAGEMLVGKNREDMFKALKSVLNVFSITFGTAFGVVFILAIGIYIAGDMHMYFNGVLRLIPPGHRARTRQIMLRLGHVIRWWLIGQSLSMLILGSTVFAGLHLIGIPNAVVLALLTALMTFIPNLGPFIAFIPIALVAALQSTLHLVYVGIFYVIIQSLEGFVLTPMIHRKVITLPPVLIIATQVLLLTLLGWLGVILAMPLVACAMILVEMVYIEDILGDKERIL